MSPISAARGERHASIATNKGTPGARSQTGGAYSLSWNTIDGGGITVAQGGAYALGGTVGQPDPGAQGGGQYSLEGGFWSGASGPGVIYLPLVQR